MTVMASQSQIQKNGYKTVTKDANNLCNNRSSPKSKQMRFDQKFYPQNKYNMEELQSRYAFIRDPLLENSQENIESISDRLLIIDDKLDQQMSQDEAKSDDEHAKKQHNLLTKPTSSRTKNRVTFSPIFSVILTTTSPTPTPTTLNAEVTDVSVFALENYEINLDGDSDAIDLKQSSQDQQNLSKTIDERRRSTDLRETTL